MQEVESAISKGYSHIIFDNMNEALITEIVKKVELVIRIVNAPNNIKFFLTTSSLNAKESYIEHCKLKNKSPLFEIITVNVFEGVMQGNYNFYISQKNNYTHEYKITNREKKFVCFNKVPRLHRIMIMSGLIERNLFNLGYCSFEGDPNLLSTIDTFLPSNVSENFKIFKNKLPLRLNITKNRSNPIDIVDEDVMYHDTSYFSIVTETTFYNDEQLNFTTCETLDSLFLTEKTFRPIALKHPFLLVSNYRALKGLRSLGYKTFHPFINENYDNEFNDKIRLQLILNEAERLCKLSDEEWIHLQQKIKPIIEHNFKLLTTRRNFLITKDILKLFS